MDCPTQAQQQKLHYFQKPNKENYVIKTICRDFFLRFDRPRLFKCWEGYPLFLLDHKAQDKEFPK